MKPAALGTRSGVIGVLATAGTLKGSKYLTTKGKFEDNVRIVEAVGRGFVELVEAGQLEGPHTEDVVKASLQPLLDAGADTVVLGCTHYPFLKDVISRNLVDVMEERKLIRGDAAGEQDIELVSSGDPAPLERIFRMINTERV